MLGNKLKNKREGFLFKHIYVCMYVYFLKPIFIKFNDDDDDDL